MTKTGIPRPGGAFLELTFFEVRKKQTRRRDPKKTALKGGLTMINPDLRLGQSLSEVFGYQARKDLSCGKLLATVKRVGGSVMVAFPML